MRVKHASDPVRRPELDLYTGLSSVYSFIVKRPITAGFSGYGAGDLFRAKKNRPQGVGVYLLRRQYLIFYS